MLAISTTGWGLTIVGLPVAFVALILYFLARTINATSACPTCGAEIRRRWHYCSHCGQELRPSGYA